MAVRIDLRTKSLRRFTYELAVDMIHPCFSSGILLDEKDDDAANEDDPIRYAPNEECTMELRTSIGTQIRLVFYSMVGQLRDDYDQDYPTKSACLRIHDVNDRCVVG
jgi:hypothetical protein